METLRSRFSLRHLCFPAEQSLGRRYPELPHPYRTDFQRDRDRVVHARAFRRLEGKTQVFAPGYSDHFRNRLTHTLEVSQMARTLAHVLDLEEHFTEALALAHDIGHPPFAHAGEEELDRQMRCFGDQFDHNLHALRLVETFEQSYARFPGLNLTFEVREGIVKHSRDFAAGEFPELDEYLAGQRPPLEAQLIDLADEIAYNTADLDDAYSAKFFSADDLATAVPRYGEIREGVETSYPGATDRVQFSESLRVLINELVSGLIQGTVEAASQAGVQTSQDVRQYSTRLAAFTPESQRTNSQVKQFLRRRVYYSDRLVAERNESARKIGDLFQFFLAHPERMPEQYVEEIHETAPHRVVCDFIAGMTDGYFQRVYERTLG